MIVLGSFARTEDLTLVIPPFHTGHLGLIPGTGVHVGLMTPYRSGPRHCEVVLTPFQQPTTNMALVKCTLLDRIGVVGRLVNAVSDLDINIVTLESTVLNHLNHHLVTMLLDFSTSTLRHVPSGARVRQLYAQFEHCLPLQDERFVRLFESIALHSADVWTTREVAGRIIPNLRLEPLSARQFHVKEGLAVIERHPTRAFHVKIILPPEVARSLRQSLDTSAPLRYMLFSDTDERTLRVFFPRPDTRIYRVGFTHNDNPGALTALLRALASANFNILGSLLRRQTADRSVWEATLEHRGDGEPDPDASREARIQWVARRLVDCADNPLELKTYDIEVGLPLYPRPATNQTIPLNPMLSTAGAGHVARVEPLALLGRTRSALRETERTPDEFRSLDSLLGAIDRRIGRTKPVIFVSYPVAARKHAELLVTRLRDTFDTSDYFDATGDVILEEVVARILVSDYFLGIWHHDDQAPMGDGKFNISPWMPFEYGVALAAGKQSHIVHSEKLHEQVWKRINPAVGNPPYSDLFFNSDTIEAIAKYCSEHWKQSETP